MSDKALVAQDITNKAVGNDVLLGRIFSNSKKANSLESIIGPEKFNTLKASYLDDLLKRGKDDINFSQAANTMAKKKPILKEMLRSDEYESIKNLSELGQKIGAPIAHGVPETGVTGLFKNIPEQVIRGLSTEKLLEYLKGSKISTDAPSIAPLLSDTALSSTSIIPASKPAGGLTKRLKAAMVTESVTRDRSDRNKRLRALGE